MRRLHIAATASRRAYPAWFESTIAFIRRYAPQFVAVQTVLTMFSRLIIRFVMKLGISTVAYRATRSSSPKGLSWRQFTVWRFSVNRSSEQSIALTIGMLIRCGGAMSLAPIAWRYSFPCPKGAAEGVWVFKTE